MVERRDIILAKIFFSDTPEAKMRPCIVLSGRDYEPGFLLISPITSAPGPHCIKIAKSDATCELAHDSSARADVIMRICKSEEVQKIGQVPLAFYNRLAEHIIRLIK